MSDKLNILGVKEAFGDWISKRKPSDFDHFVKKGRKYPVFLVAAQGGGYYAAYHSALVLARLQDRCPKFASHVFAISGVSGGSLGGAVFAESIRLKESTPRAAAPGSNMPESVSHRCEGKNGGHEKAVRRFFDFDFLTPVIAAGLLFDVPRVLVPQLPGPRRGDALVASFEDAWNNTNDGQEDQNAFTRKFYGIWKPEENVPALFLNATSVNTGIATVASQLHLNAYSTVSDTKTDSEDKKFQDAIKEASEEISKDAKRARRSLISAFKDRNYKPPLLSNILDFKPDIKPTLGEAVAISAGFPIISPTARYRRGSASHPRDKILSATEELQLVDGGYYDNSGLFTIKYVLEEIIKKLEDKNLKGEVKNRIGKVEFHVISLTHDPGAFYEVSKKKGFAELIAPLAAFEMIRQARSRGYDAELVKTVKKIKLHVHRIRLFDRSFQAPLSWFLSKSTKRFIDLRSGGSNLDISDEDKVCCHFYFENFAQAPHPSPGDPPLAPKFYYIANKGEREAFDLLNKQPPFVNRIQPFVPNEEELHKIIDLISDGGELISDGGEEIKPE